MEILKLEEVGFDACVGAAASALRKGDVILYPTDTLYGLGGDAFSDEAFEKVCDIKDRDERRPIHAVFADMDAVDTYAKITPLGRKLAEKFLPGPITLIFEKREGVTGGIARDLTSIGIRIPKNDFCIALAKRYGRPFTTTSANKSGEPSCSSIDEIRAQLGERAEGIALAIDAGTVPAHLRSTVVDVRGEEPFVIREGVIATSAIEEAAR